MAYFGFLDSNILQNISSKKAGDILIQEKYYGFTEGLKKSITNTKTMLSNASFKTIRFVFEAKYYEDDIIFNNKVATSENKEKLKNKFYQTILDSYHQYIIEIKSEFYKIFKDEIFGLDSKNQKEIALKYYKEIYNNICLEETKLLYNVSSGKEIKHDSTLSKLEVVFRQKEIFKNNLIPIAKLIFRLLDERKFIKNFKPKLTIIDEILNYEIWKQIMVELNNEFDFEEDLFSTDGINDRATYEKYTHIFNSYEAYCFAKMKIYSFKTYPKAKSVALYQMLVDYDLLKEHHDNYKDYIETEFGFRPSKIVKYEEKLRPTYDRRIKEYKEEWDNLTSKKE